MSNWYTGNANDDADDNRGWILGHFLPDGDVRQTSDVEIKWGIHPTGDTRDEWASDANRTTVLILVSGRFELTTREHTVTLEQQGDYVVWGPGTEHVWHAPIDAVVVTIRWGNSRILSRWRTGQI